MLFEVGRKPKVSLAAKRSMKFSGLSTTFIAVLVLPLLLWFYVTYWIRSANFTTQQSTWKLALNKIFRVRDVNNVLHIYKVAWVFYL